MPVILCISETFLENEKCVINWSKFHMYWKCYNFFIWIAEFVVLWAYTIVREVDFWHQLSIIHTFELHFWIYSNAWMRKKSTCYFDLLDVKEYNYVSMSPQKQQSLPLLLSGNKDNCIGFYVIESLLLDLLSQLMITSLHAVKF